MRANEPDINEPIGKRTPGYRPVVDELDADDAPRVKPILFIAAQTPCDPAVWRYAISNKVVRKNGRIYCSLVAIPDFFNVLADRPERPSIIGSASFAHAAPALRSSATPCAGSAPFGWRPQKSCDKEPAESFGILDGEFHQAADRKGLAGPTRW